MPARDAEAGFTLIELMIALALFALISLAGLAMVDGVLGIERRTDGRLERLAAVERGMFILSNDLTQLAGGRVEGGGGGLLFSRPAPGAGGVPVEMRYRLAGGALARSIEGVPAPQTVLDGVTGARFSFYAPGRGWLPAWPPSDKEKDLRPAAIAVDVALAPGRPGVGGTLRRVVALPAQP